MHAVASDDPMILRHWREVEQKPSIRPADQSTDRPTNRVRGLEDEATHGAHMRKRERAEHHSSPGDSSAPDI